MQNKPFRLGPSLLTTSVANLLNPPATSGGVGAGTPNTFILLKHFRILNVTGSAATFSLWIGATGASAAGTQVMGAAKSVPANDHVDFYPAGGLRLDVADFLTQQASAANALVLTAEGEIGIA